MDDITVFCSLDKQEILSEMKRKIEEAALDGPVIVFGMNNEKEF